LNGLRVDQRIVKMKAVRQAAGIMPAVADPEIFL
jgi:hypothetical protein